MAEKNKKTFKMPHTFVIMMVIILFATLLTWSFRQDSMCVWKTQTE